MIDVESRSDQTAVCGECGHRVPLSQLALSPGESVMGLEFTDDGEEFAQAARKAMERKIRVICGGCKRGLWVGSRLAGKRARCPGCGKNIRIPALADLDEEDDFAMLGLRLASQGIEGKTEELDADHSGEYPAIEEPELPGRPEIAPYEPGAENEIPAEDRKRMSGLMILGGIGVAAVVIAGIVLMALFTSGKEDATDDTASDTSEILGQTGDPDVVKQTPNQADRPVVVATAPSDKPTTRITSKPIPPQPARSSASFALVGQQPGHFRAGGYYPAAPDKTYLEIEAVVKAGDEPVLIRNPGRSVQLRFGQIVAALIEFSSRESDSLLGRRLDRLRLEPREKRLVRMTFELPELAGTGVLAVAGVGESEVTVDLQPEPAPAGAIVGTWREHPPRSLQPMLPDPAMAAVQQAVDHRLEVTAADDSVHVRIPQAPVAGTAKSIAPNLYSVDLKAGGHRLQGKLRLIDDGQTLILYLSDQPMHQIVYTRRAQ
ncbi:MAG: hypothetical protein ACLFVU_11075 [Phycisphaerae bacterium]